MTDTKINNNKHHYVDLDLPSGTLWATMNVGAANPLDCGLYFQWGDTKGYTFNQVGKDKKFDWKNYKLCDLPNDIFIKYSDKGDTLAVEDDAASVNMGGDWHMPTSEQCQELIDCTTNEICTMNGISGIRFTSKEDTSKFIFIPAAGYAWDCSVSYKGYSGYIWSSVLSPTYISSGEYFHFNSAFASVDANGRYYGLSVRGVIDKNDYNFKIMDEKLNLAEILKDVPKGTKLWSPICGDCEFVKIDEDATLPIKCFVLEVGCYWCFREDGSFTSYKSAECVLFPSKENRDWSTFKTPKKHKHFDSFQKVLRVDNNHPDSKVWTADLYSHYEEATDKHYLTSRFIMDDNEIIPYDGNEDKAGKPVD